MKNLKKIVISSLALLLCVVGVGCSDSNGEDSVSINVADVRGILNTSNLLKLDYTDVNAKEHYIFEGNVDKIKEGFVSQAMINIKLQDVIVVEANSASDAKTLMKALEVYKNDSLRMFADGYGGEENATAVANSKLVQKGNIVYFIAAEEVDAIEDLILGK